jgi:hypothetical protein
MGRRSAPLLVAHSASTPSPTIFPETAPLQGVGVGVVRAIKEWRADAGRSTDLLGARASAARERLFRWAPHESGSTVGPLERRESPNMSSSLQSYRAPPPVASVMTTLQHRRVATTRTTPTCCSG